jgi:hypothetical protein
MPSVRLERLVLVRVARVAQAVQLRGTLVHLRLRAALVGLQPQAQHLLGAQVALALILAVLVARHHVTVHQALELRPGTVVDLLEKLDAFRRPERFEEVLLACLIDATGRGGKADSPYPQAERLRTALAKVLTLDVREVLAKTPPGPAVKDAIRRARMRLLSPDEAGTSGED